MYCQSVFYRVTLAVLFSAFMLMVFASYTQAADNIPSTVQKRIRDIDKQLDTVKTGIEKEYVNQPALDRAKELLNEIKTGYADFASHPDVKAAEDRIAAVELAASDLTKRKQSTKEAAANESQSLADRCRQWVEKLAIYKPSLNIEDKGNFGSPSTDADRILKCKPNYLEAKALYDEYKKTGLSENDSWELRDPDYQINVGLENYNKSVDNVVSNAEKPVDEGLAWLDSQKSEGKMISMPQSQRELIDNYVAEAGKLLDAQDPRMISLTEKHQALIKRLAEIDVILLEKVRMKPDVYKGADSAKLKGRAKAIALKEKPKAKILRIHITRKTWERESVVEYSDTTNTALQHRITDGIYAQVAAKDGETVMLYTIFLNKNKISGSQGGLQGHIMYKDRILEKNVK